MTARSILAPTALLVAVLVAGCSSQAEIPPPPRVARAALVQPASDLSATIYPGEVRSRYESELGFRVSGKISARHVDVGAHVVQGQLLASLDPRDLQLARSSAEAALGSARAAFQLAQSEHDRYAALYERRFVSQFERDAKVNALAAARAQVDEARAALDVARNQAAYAELRADADGVITTVSGEAGQVVAAGQPIVRLARDGASEVEISVPEHLVSRYAPGQEAMINLWADGDKLHHGRIREVAPGADAVTRTYRLRVAFADEAAAPRLGQTARVHFANLGGRAQWQVPLSAVHEFNGKPALWRIDPETHQVDLVPVSVIAYAEDVALIGVGLELGDWVVSAGVHRMRAGEVIVPVDARNRRIEL